MRTSRISTLVLGALTLAACGGNDQPAAPANPAPQAQVAPAPTPAPATPAPAAAALPDASQPLAVSMTPVGNKMEYKQTEFTARPGQQVTITFKNTASSPAMQHNVVVVKTEAAIEEVGQAAMGAADTGYVPADKASLIIASTPMATTGQTVSVTFTAPSEPGDYPYICTYPGHYMLMRGVMRVVA